MQTAYAGQTSQPERPETLEVVVFGFVQVLVDLGYSLLDKAISRLASVDGLKPLKHLSYQLSLLSWQSIRLIRPPNDLLGEGVPVIRWRPSPPIGGRQGRCVCNSLRQGGGSP